MDSLTKVLWITHTNNEWTALSAVGSLSAAAVAGIAAIIALYVPFRINAIAKKQAKKALRIRQHEIASATYNALDVVASAIDARSQSDANALHTASAKAAGLAETLPLLVDYPGLTDGPIVAAMTTRQALLAVIRAGEALRTATLKAATNNPTALGNPNTMNQLLSITTIYYELDAALTLAKESQIRIDKVRNYHDIQVRSGGIFPVLPAAV